MFLKSPRNFLLQIALTLFTGYGISLAAKFSIPLGGNAFITVSDNSTQENIRDAGLKGWSSTNAIISIYFKTTQPETFTVSLKLANPDTSKIRISIGDQSHTAKIDNTTEATLPRKFSAPIPSYVKVDLQGISRSSFFFTDVTDLLLDGIKGQLTYVKDVSNFYYARRGPSARLYYETVTDDDVLYFYNEVTVPEGNDPISSYFCAIGTSEGYMGMQRNTETERRIIFSIFSKFPTDDPTKVPPESRVKLVRKGEGVTVQDFGNEGSGGQSRLVYTWKTGKTYGFLVQTKPTENNSTMITCWVNLPGANNKLRLIATFEQPGVTVYNNGLYSFEENFDPDQGFITRMGMFGRTYYYRNSTKAWKELTIATFGVDDTGLAGRRKDYTGGTSGKYFYLRNIGFINETTEDGTLLMRLPTGKKPKFDLDNLP